jgi:hypothetical protein
MLYARALCKKDDQLQAQPVIQLSCCFRPDTETGGIFGRVLRGYFV